ncbi:MAG: terpene cyclase/mutase family protein [Planctomycetes bacterium]|nr:terpene cyclase/mutase family protein [Planctomycetota bacterium]
MLHPLLVAPLIGLCSFAAAQDPVVDRVPTQEEIAAAITKACALLVANQENYAPDRPVGTIRKGLEEWQQKEASRLAGLRADAASKASEWPYEGVYRVAPDGRIPAGYRVGGSAIVCSALLYAPGLDDARRQAVLRSVTFMLDMIDDDEGMAPKAQTDYDVRGWGQAYALAFFLQALDASFLSAEDPLRERVTKSIPHLIACLEKGQVRGGGWNYAGRSVSPFMTGSTLLALFHARARGYEVDAEMIDDALGALERGRGKSMAYAYSGSLREGREEPMQGASARSAIAELVLYRAGRSDLDNLARAVDAFFREENWKELRVRKSQQGTHVPPYSVAPYYFFYGHTYAALAVEHLPEADRAAYREKMRELLWRTIEANGGWNDRVFPRTESYSTAMAVLALLAPELPPVPEYQSTK